MQRYIATRLVYSIPVLILVATLVFFSLRLVPGDVLTARFEDDSRITPETLEAIRDELGINEPAWKQYLPWMGGVIQGDFGDSLLTGRPASDAILRGLPITLEIALWSSLLSVLIGVPAGIASAVWRYGVTDYTARLAAVLGQSVPNFVLATLFVLLPALWFGWSAPIGYKSMLSAPVAHFQQLGPAVLVLGFSLSASIMRMTRSSMLEVLSQEYILVARSKGLAERFVVFRHALKNAFIPVLTTIGNQLGFLIGGSVIVESVFGLPGLGQLVLHSIQIRDYTQVQGAVVLIALGYVLINLIIDVSYGWFDPRVRYE